ncbi:hypothetical protein CHUAL_003915 [Chamberlinius hualienensis]
MHHMPHTLIILTAIFLYVFRTVISISVCDCANCYAVNQFCCDAYQLCCQDEENLKQHLNAEAASENGVVSQMFQDETRLSISRAILGRDVLKRISTRKTIETRH